MFVVVIMVLFVLLGGTSTRLFALMNHPCLTCRNATLVLLVLLLLLVF